MLVSFGIEVWISFKIFLSFNSARFLIFSLTSFSFSLSLEVDMPTFNLALSPTLARLTEVFLSFDTIFICLGWLNFSNFFFKLSIVKSCLLLVLNFKSTIFCPEPSPAVSIASTFTLRYIVFSPSLKSVYARLNT